MHRPHIPRATVRDLRNNFAEVSAWVEAGREVEITKRGRVVAKLVPVTSQKNPARWDPKARLAKLKEMSGGKTYPGSIILEAREERDW